MGNRCGLPFQGRLHLRRRDRQGTTSNVISPSVCPRIVSTATRQVPGVIPRLNVNPRYPFSRPAEISNGR